MIYGLTVKKNPDKKLILCTDLPMRLQLEGCDIEPDLLARWSTDDPRAVLKVWVVLGGESRGPNHTGSGEIVTSTDLS